MLAITPISQLGKLRSWKLDPPWETWGFKGRAGLNAIALSPFLTFPPATGVSGARPAALPPPS